MDHLNRSQEVLEIPEKEPARQQYFTEKCAELVSERSKSLGRPLTCCINTFGCPTV